MKEVLQKKTLFVVIPLLIALLSVFVLSGPASSPDLHGPHPGSLGGEADHRAGIVRRLRRRFCGDHADPR